MGKQVNRLHVGVCMVPATVTLAEMLSWRTFGMRGA
jgi:hypothetical protein